MTTDLGCDDSNAEDGNPQQPIAANFAPLLDSGDGRAAMVVWEHSDTRGARLGVSLLTAPPPVMDHLCRDLAPPEAL